MQVSCQTWSSHEIKDLRTGSRAAVKFSDTHWSARGHDLVAETLAALIAERGWLK